MAFREPRLENTIPIPNLYPYSGTESLPPGSLIPDRYLIKYRNPLDIFVEETANRLGINFNDPSINTFCPSGQAVFLGARYGSLLAGIEDNNPVSFAIAYHMADILPNLSWIRGGDLTIKQGVAVFDKRSTDGLLGQPTENNAKYAYGRVPRPQPCILCCRWKDLLDARQQGILQLGSTHSYDTTVIHDPNNPEVITWSKRYLSVYDCQDYFTR